MQRANQKWFAVSSSKRDVTNENGPKVVLKAACLESNLGGNSQLYAGTSLELHLLIQLRLSSKNGEDWTIRRKFRQWRKILRDFTLSIHDTCLVKELYGSII